MTMSVLTVVTVVMVTMVAMAVLERVTTVWLTAHIRATDPLHGVLKILRTVWMIVSLLKYPLIEVRVALGKLCCRTRLVLFNGCPRVVVKVIE